MPYKNPKDRKYKNAAKYEDSPQQVKNREGRNTARKKLAKLGKVSKGDGKDVDHITPESKGGKTVMSNLRVESASDNRSFTRNSDHTVKINRPKRRK